MKDAKKDLQALLAEVVSEFAVSGIEITIETPTGPSHGDYTSNVSLVLFSKLAKSSTDCHWKKPSELAQYLVDQIQEKQPKWLESVVVAGPGFINFTLTRDCLVSNIGFFLSLGNHAESQRNQNQKIIVEFTDPNPFKEFHIGHLYSNTVGESICRLLEATGATVCRADYFGDVGMHVAKSIWGMRQQLMEQALTLHDLAQWDLDKRIKFLGQVYAVGATAYEDDTVAQEAMRQLNFLIYKAGQDRLIEQEQWQPVIDFDRFITEESKKIYPEVKEIFFTGRAWSLEYFESIYNRLGMKFDFYYPESKAGEWGTKIVTDQLEKGIFEKSQGAVIFAGSQHGLHDRVFLNSLGLPTYEAKELALPKLKLLDYAYDRSIIITANEINEYFKVLIKVLSLIEPEIAAKTTHIGHGVVRLPEGKMSSHTGKIIAGSWLLDEAKAEVIKMAAQTKKFSHADQEEMGELVGQAAIKYAFLKQSIGGNLAFSFSESLDFQGNSGPYLLYSYVRAQNVLRQAGEVSKTSIEQLIDTVSNKKIDNAEDYSKLEIDLLRNIEKYKDIIEQAALEYAPHLLCTYLYGLAQIYNSWYASQKIVALENGQLTNLSLVRLQLNLVVGTILKRGLYLLGIRTVEKM